jgi:hypothetical protein
MRRAAAFLLLLSLSAVTSAQGLKPKPTGVFSDMRHSKESGDVIGTEVFIVFGGNKGLFATIQCAEGWPSKPVVVPVRVDGDKVEIAAHNDSQSHCPKVPFRGTVSAKGLEGTFEGTQHKQFLRRTKSIWQ